jgi:hypothetical protein
MNLTTLTSAVDVERLQDDSSLSLQSGMLIPLAACLAAISTFVALRSIGTKGSRKAFLSVIALTLFAGSASSLFLMESQRPDADDVVTKAFAAEYPDLTMYADDLDCIDTMLNAGWDGPAKTCSATRKVDGGFAKVEYAKYRGKFVVTTPGGTNVTADSDLVVIEGS